MKPLRFLLFTLIGAVLHIVCIYYVLKMYAIQTSVASLGAASSFRGFFGVLIGTIMTSIGLYLLTLMTMILVGTVHGGMILASLIISLKWLKATPIAIGDFLIKKDNLFLNILRVAGYLLTLVVTIITFDFCRLAKAWSWWGAGAMATAVMCCIYINWLVTVGKKILVQIQEGRQRVIVSR